MITIPYKSSEQWSEDGGFWRDCARLVVFPANHQGGTALERATATRERPGWGEAERERERRPILEPISNCGGQFVLAQREM